MSQNVKFIASYQVTTHDAKLIFPNGRVIEQWPQQVENQRVTHIMLRPVALHRFVESARDCDADLSSLRVMAYGAAALPKKLLEEARIFIPCEWIQGYGLSETFGPFCWLTEEDHKRKLYKENIYCVGRPDDSLDVSLYFSDITQKDVGEVILRGAGLMEGYLDIDSGQVQPVSEYFHTGDYGHFSKNGELILKGRISNTILSKNGHRIYPEEIESVIAGIVGVKEVILLGIPIDHNLGNTSVVCIYGSLTQKSNEDISRAILNQLTMQLSKEKWPDYIYPSCFPFPKSCNDKIIKGKVLQNIDEKSLIPISVLEEIA